jgi:hypothetical protein
MQLDQDEIMALGASLRRINQKLLKTENFNKIIRLWYQGGEPYFDVFFDVRDNQIVWFQFTLRGKSITWDRKTVEAQTGLTYENRIESNKYPASKIIETDNDTDRSFIALARSILLTRTDEAIFTDAIAILNPE